MVITDYKGMTVAEISDFRQSLKGASVEYRVIKNTYARIAIVDTPVAAAKDSFNGPVGIAIGYDDPVTVAKAVLEFAKKSEKLKVQSGVIDGVLCDPERLKQISVLPSRDALLGMLAGCMQAPTSQMARLLSATVTRMGYAMTALMEKKSAEPQENTNN